MVRWTPIRYAGNGDVSIAYTVAGDGPVDLLFMGGFVSHLEIGIEPPLAERFWERMGSFARVIAFDKRGMGLSDTGAYTLENIVGDALAVLDACGVERTVVFGVSEGGAAATMLAATHPERVSAMVQYGTYARMSRAPTAMSEPARSCTRSAPTAPTTTSGRSRSGSRRRSTEPAASSAVHHLPSAGTGSPPRRAARPNRYARSGELSHQPPLRLAADPEHEPDFA